MNNNDVICAIPNEQRKMKVYENLSFMNAERKSTRYLIVHEPTINNIFAFVKDHHIKKFPYSYNDILYGLFSNVELIYDTETRRATVKMYLHDKVKTYSN